MTGPAQGSTRVLTIPNLVSFARLAGVPLFLYLVLGPHEDGWAVVVLAIGGTSDWVDGFLARRLNQTSRLGELLDPLADRLYIVATVVALTIREVIPLWFTLALLARELLLGVCLLVLRRYGYGPPPVHYVGKSATFILLLALPILLLLKVSPRHRVLDLPEWLEPRVVGACPVLDRGAVLCGASRRGRPSGPTGSGRAGVGVKRGSADPAVPPMPADDGQRFRPNFLLELFTDPLDPGYADAAAARATSGPKPAWRRACAFGLRTLALVLVGFVLAVAYREAIAAEPERSRAHAGLVEEAKTSQARTDALQAQSDQLRREVTAAEQAALGGSAEELRRVRELEAAAGLAAVTGPGVVVRLDRRARPDRSEHRPAQHGAGEPGSRCGPAECGQRAVGRGC